MQDRRRRAGLAHVSGGCRESAGAGRASVPGQDARDRLPPAVLRVARTFRGRRRNARTGLSRYRQRRELRRGVVRARRLRLLPRGRGGHGSVDGHVKTKSLCGLQRCRCAAGRFVSGRVRVRGARSGGAGHPPGRGGRSGRARTRLDDRSGAGGFGADGRRRDEDGRIQHDGSQPVARHAAATRPRRACADAGGGGGGDVPDRSLALSYHQQRRHQAGGGHHAGPLQRHHPERAGFRDERRGDRPLLVRRSGIPWLGRADIGHDVDNKIVPFGTYAPSAPAT